MNSFARVWGWDLYYKKYWKTMPFLAKVRTLKPVRLVGTPKLKGWTWGPFVAWKDLL